MKFQIFISKIEKKCSILLGENSNDFTLMKALFQVEIVEFSLSDSKSTKLKTAILNSKFLFFFFLIILFKFE